MRRGGRLPVKRQAQLILVALSVVTAALVAPGAGAHDGVMTAADHAAEDSVVHTAAQERALEAHTRVVTAQDARAAAAVVAGGPEEVGQWGPVVAWPVVGVHVALLPNGKVLAYDSIGDNATETYPVHDHTRATVWDPATGSQTPVTVDTGFNVFCSGLAHLVDGRVFLAGGNKDPQLNGIRQTHLFDPLTNLWSLGPNMLGERWYPTVTPLNNGELLITSGRQATPEVRTRAGGLRALSTASLSLPLYPWMDLAPNGLAFYSGPNQTLRTLNPAGTGTWQTLGQRDAIDRDYGGHTLFDIGKMLVAGGGPSTRDARVVDVNGPTPQVSTTTQMAFGRRQHNLTVLADGTVLATGGNSSGAALVDLNASVYAAEQWNPATGQWRTLAPMQITRQYHSIALLLPDGRVLSAGGGICGECDAVGYLAKNAEIFSPPYLFEADGTLAPRPSINAAPASTGYGAAMEIVTGNPASIRKVALVRLGAVTHSNNMEQRYVPLSFTAGASSITATAPANANVAPPGPYMLFIINANGVPSVARMVTVQHTPTVTLTQPTDGATFSAPATVNLAATASDADGTVTKVEFFNGTTKLGEDTTAPYGFIWSGVAAGSYTLTARATDDLAATSASVASTVTVSDNQPPRTVELRFESEPSGLELSVGGSSSTTPFTRSVIEGSNIDVVAPSPQALGGSSYAWGSWSDGGAQSHSIVANAAATYSASYQAAPVPSSLVAGYSFDEGLGTSVADASGKGNTGAIGSASWSTAGRFGNALSFNGTSARVTVPDSASLDLTSAMTLEAWVFPTAGPGVWRDVIYKGPDDIYYLMSSSDSSTPAAGGIFSGPLYGTSTLPLNVWSHLAATFDGTILRLYVNGIQVSSYTPFTPITTSSGALTIGGDALYGQFFAGRIDEVRIYNTALSASQIQTDMATPVVPDTQPPSAPTALGATPVSGSRINLAWTASTDNVGVSGYRVERCQGAGCSSFVQVGTPAGTSFSDTGLQSGTSYSYRVRATDGAGNLGPYSGVQSATTPAPDTQPPSTPTGLGATPVSASADQSGLGGVDRRRRCERLPGRALSGCGLFELRPGRDPDRGEFQRHRLAAGHELQLPGARDRRDRQPERLLQYAKRHDPDGEFESRRGVFL